jgi:hypothetical protein
MSSGNLRVENEELPFRKARQLSILQSEGLVPLRQSLETQGTKGTQLNDSLAMSSAAPSLGRASVQVQTEFVYSSNQKHSVVHLHGDWNGWEPIGMHVEKGNLLQGNKPHLN